MRWRQIGPFRGGRALAIEGVTGEPDTYYFGAVAGGVWKSTDGGANWIPLFDKQPISSIGAIAVAPSDHNVIYAGTGEAAIRGNTTYGTGVFKSIDAGKTWENVGLKDTRQIGALIVDPRNENVVLVAATPAASTLFSIRIIRTSSLHHFGRRDGSHGFSPVAALAVDFIGQKTTASRGNVSRATDFLAASSAKSASPFPARILTASMQSSRRRKAVSTAPTMQASIGPELMKMGGFVSAPGISVKSMLTQNRRTRFTS